MSSDETVRITYDAEFEPGEIAGINGEGLQAGQRVILVQPEDVTEEPLEWPGIVEEVRERRCRQPACDRRCDHWWAGVRLADRDVTVSYTDLRIVLDYARHFDVDDDPAMIRVTDAAERYRKDWGL